MSKEEYQADSRLKNIGKTEDASTNKDADKLIEVKKKDTSEDKENKFIVHDKPADEQMIKSLEDRSNNAEGEEAD